MLFSLFGCATSGKTALSPEMRAKSYLEDKYGEAFEIIDFSRKNSGGPFSDREYTGNAFAENSPSLIFNIWASKDLKTFEDSYFCVRVMPEIDTWLYNEAASIWKACKIRDQVELLDYNGDPSYDLTDVETFFQTESVSNTIRLYLPKDNSYDLSSMVWNYLQRIANAKSGILYVYLLEENTYSALDIYDPGTTDYLQYDYSISLGSDRTAVDNAFRNR